MSVLYQSLMSYAISFFNPARRRQLASEICGLHPHYLPGNMLTCIHRRYGVGTLLFADLILFGWCVLACLAADLFLGHHVVLHEIIGFLSCTLAFCLCEDQELRSFLKLLYLSASVFWGDYWTLTAIIMIIFEHLVSENVEQKGVWRN